MKITTTRQNKGKIMRHVRPGAHCTGIAPKGQRAAAVAAGGGTLKVFNPAQMKKRAETRRGIK